MRIDAKKVKRMEREVALEPAAEDVGLLFSDDEVEGGGQKMKRWVKLCEVRVMTIV